MHKSLALGAKFKASAVPIFARRPNVMLAYLYLNVTSLMNRPKAMLGGLWGCKLNSPPEIRQKWKEAWIAGMQDELMWANRTEKGPDQRFLKKFVKFLFLFCGWL